MLRLNILALDPEYAPLLLGLPFTLRQFAGSEKRTLEMMGQYRVSATKKNQQNKINGSG